MSIAGFAAAEAAIAQVDTKKQSNKPPSKRTVVAISDAVTVSEAR